MDNKEIKQTNTHIGKGRIQIRDVDLQGRALGLSAGGVESSGPHQVN